MLLAGIRNIQTIFRYPIQLYSVQTQHLPLLILSPQGYMFRPVKERMSDDGLHGPKHVAL
jgi:hypothetical protein